MTADPEAPIDRKSGPPRSGSALDRLKSGPFPRLALILIVAAAVRLIGIGQQSFSIDELSELRIAHSSIADIVTFGDGFPPLYHLILHFFVPLGDLSGRILSALFGVATVGVVWAWARRAAGDRVGLYTALFVALCPVAVDFSMEGRAYTLMGLLAASSLWALWAALERPSPWRWVGWGVLSALGLYTHYLFLPLIAAGVVLALLEVRGRPLRGMLIGVGALVALAAPILLLLPGDMALQVTDANIGLRPGEWLYAGYVLLTGFFLGPAERDLPSLGLTGALQAGWVWMALLVPLLSVLAVRGWRAASRPTGRRLLVFSASGLAIIALVLLATNSVVGPRYLLWLVIPLALWLSIALTALPKHWRWAAAAVLVAVGVSAAVIRVADPNRHIPDARGVATYLESSGALDDPVLVAGSHRARFIVYYIDRPRALALPDEWDPQIGRLGYYPDEQLLLVGIPPLDTDGFELSDALALVDARTEPGRPYHLVYSQPHHNDPHGELLRALTASDGLSLVRAFAGLELYRGIRSGA